jgi:hypothetical protein
MEICFPKTLDQCISAAHQFSLISTNGIIDNCVGVLDGYHMEIAQPSASDVQNVSSFFSGHYKTHGLNIQACCDSNCRFTFIGVAGPGVMGDREAVERVALGELVRNLPGQFCCIADCAYTPSETMIPIFRSDNARLDKNDNFNFFASQLRIRIEMAFGLMINKWCLLKKALQVNIRHMRYLVPAVAKLHNFCINERLREQGHVQFNNWELDNVQNIMRYAEVGEEWHEVFQSPWSANRGRMADKVQAAGLVRPNKRRRGIAH